MTMNDMYELLTGWNAWSIAFRILLSAILGGVIGWERGHHGRAAGMRTHILVCLGAAVATLVGLYAAFVLDFNNDPLRVGAQVVSGIGFLGVGTIMVRNREQVTGLTTAAGLWVTASIGLAVGIGFYLTAILAFVVVIIAFSILGHLEFRARPKDVHTCYIEFMALNRLKDFYNEIKPVAEAINIIPAKSGIKTHVGVEIQIENLENRNLIYQAAESCQDVMIVLPSQKQA